VNPFRCFLGYRSGPPFSRAKLTSGCASRTRRCNVGFIAASTSRILSRMFQSWTEHCPAYRRARSSLRDGAGKTELLRAPINERKVTRPDTNIIMVEDPIEYRLAGVTQVQVNANAGLGFPQVLRSMLRQDPDVIVVGEMRDEDTARIGLEAAMTGHLLLTSLHANHTIAAVQRLENLGTGRALIAQSIHLVLVQRLVRKLCSACRKLDPPVPALLESLVARGIVDKGQQTLPRAVGCDACGGTGYVGRAAVVEALQINDAVREAIGAGRSLADVHHIATETRALTPFIDYARHLLQKQIISASEVLLSVAD